MIMKNVNFGNEVLSKGAILGVLMLASNLVEQSAMIYGGTIGWMSFVGVESIAVTVVYIWLLYRFAKNYSLAVYESRRDPKYFSYGEGLGYVVSVAVLAGVIVASGGYLFRHFAIGYDNYIAGYMQMMQNVLGIEPDSGFDGERVRTVVLAVGVAVRTVAHKNRLFGCMVVSVLRTFTRTDYRRRDKARTETVWRRIGRCGIVSTYRSSYRSITSGSRCPNLWHGLTACVAKTLCHTRSSWWMTARPTIRGASSAG